MACSPPGSSVHGDSPGQNTGVVAMPPSRGSSQSGNAGLLDCRQILYCLRHQESPFQTRETCNFLFIFHFPLRELQNHHLQVDYFFVSLLYFESTSVVKSTSLNLCSQHRDAFTFMFVFSTDLVPWEQGEKALVISVALESHTGCCQLYALEVSVELDLICKTRKQELCILFFHLFLFS